MDIKALRYFLYVAETLSFNRAAERLNTSQPVVTRMIAQLEHSIGLKLFERTTRRVSLTPAGVLLLKEAKPLMAHVESVQRTVRHAVAERSGRFAVGSTTTAMQTVTPGILRRFRQIHPDVQLDVREIPSKAQIEALLSAEIDVGFILTPASHPELTIHPIHREQMRLALPDDHPYARSARDGSSVPLSAFANDCFIIPSRQDMPAIYDEVTRACEGAGFRPKIKECPENQTCFGLAQAGLGIFFFASTRTDIPSEGLAFLEVAEPAPVLEIAVAWRTEDPSSFLDIFRDQSYQSSSVV